MIKRTLTRVTSSLLIPLLAGIAIFQAQPVYAQSAAAECANSSETLLWQVDGKNSQVFLFGSLHLGQPGFYPLAEPVENSFRNADHMVFEVDPAALLDPQIAMTMQQKGMLPPGETLSDHLSQPVIDNLKSALGQMGLPADNFMMFRPWFLTVLITNMQYMSLGYGPENGVELYLHREKPDNADVIGLETMEQQLDFLQSLDGEAYLAYTLNNLEQGKAQMQQLIDSWACADKTGLTQLFNEEFSAAAESGADTDQLKQTLLTDRNRTMADAIQRFLDTGQGQYFVAIGAAHLLGDDSVIDMLDHAGYEADAVSR